MLQIYSKDSVLINLCVDLFGKNNNVTVLKGKTALKNLKHGSSDILILDLECLEEKNLPEITCPSMALAAVPAHAQAMRLLRKGFRAYGNRYMHEENLIQAVNALKAGQIWLPPGIINHLISALPDSGTPEKQETLFKDLTSREIQVAQWVANGLSNIEISEKMFISVRTVKAHLSSIFKKTGCHNRLELATRLK